MSQVASLQDTHVFSPEALNTARIGFSRAAYNFNAPQITPFPQPSILSPAMAAREASWWAAE